MNEITVMQKGCLKMYDKFFVKNGWLGKKQGDAYYLYNVAGKEFAVFESRKSFEDSADTVLQPAVVNPEPDFTCKPHFTAITLTTKCNMECPYCYVKPVSGSGAMTAGDARNAVKALAGQTNDELVIFAWGGEPTQNPDALLAMIEEAQNYPYIKVLLISNGVMDGDLLKRLLTYKNLVFQISFDGSMAENIQKPLITKDDSLKGMLTSMETISQISKRVSLRATVTRRNAAELRNCLVPTARRFTNRIIMEHMHVSSGRAVNLRSEAPSVEDYSALVFDIAPSAEEEGIHVKVLPLDQLREGGPNDKMNFLNILTDGSITVSNAIIHSSHVDFPTLHIGDVADGHIVFDQEKNELLAKRYLKNYQEQCQGCFAWPVCRGSVQRYLFIMHDSLSEWDDLRCQYYKAVISRWIDTLAEYISDSMGDFGATEGFIKLIPPAGKIHYPMFIMEGGLSMSYRSFYE